MEMNNYKFRGKDEDGVWRYGFYYEYAVGSFIRVPKDDGGFEDFKVDPKTVGQWTGRLDKEGAEIYADDIVVAEKNGKIFKPFIIKYDELIAKDWFGDYKFENNKLTELKVISNKHDNEPN